MEKQTVVGRTVLILIVTALAVVAFLTKGLALGQDLKGGTTLRFSLDLERAKADGVLPKDADESLAVQETLAVVENRIDRWGLAELNVTLIGDDKFEVSLPSEVDADAITGLVTSLGDLKFRIEVLPHYTGNDKAQPVRSGVWAGTAAHPNTEEGFEAFKVAEIAAWRAARERAETYKPSDPRYRLVRVHKSEGYEPDDFRVVEQPATARHDFGGSMLTDPQVGHDKGFPVVNFGVGARYQNDFGDWTEANVGLPLAIVLNDEYQSAPTINETLRDNVQISLGRSDPDLMEQEARQLVTVLQTGAIRLQPVLESKSTVGPSLAGAAVDRGITSTLLALAAVLVFMVLFYRGAGVVADVALLLNLVLLLGAMAFFGATLTLPGIAGIVLTLGMAVDANILIFERIREEQNAGRSVARAIAEGYDRAFTTIVDSNVTTFITAAFLYAFGTGTIRGYATSLSLGLLASMFTAIYVTRTFFEARLLRGDTTPIRMAGTGKPATVAWMRLRGRLIPISLVLVAASLGLFFALPAEQVYDIDFTGGLKLQARFDRPTSVDDVKRALAGSPRTVSVHSEVRASEDAPLTKEVTVGPYEGAQVVSVASEGGTGSAVEIRVPASEGVGGTSGLTERERLDALRAYVRAVLGDRLLSEWIRLGPSTYEPKPDDPHKDMAGRLHAKIALEDPAGVLTPALLEDLFAKTMPHSVYGEGGKRESYPASVLQRDVKVFPDASEGTSAGGERTFDLFWKAEKAGTPAEVDPVLLRQELREFLGGSKFRQALSERLEGDRKADAARVALADPFPVDDLIGAGVAARQRNDALVALALSLIGIVLYVAFRFRSYPMGFSAILCLFHDVAIALGAVCVVNLLGIVDAKINLGLVAAFLTIVGFSVNDTVVTFDRIRELRGKSPRITARMLDDAVNQTLSRTWRTSATALMTVLILFAANLGQRSVLEGLSFTLAVGMIAGVYSTIAIAAPLLLFLPWFWERIRRFRPRVEALTWPLRTPGPFVMAGLVVVVAVLSWFVARHAPSMVAFLALLVAPLAVTVGLWLAWAIAFAVGAFFLGYVALIGWTLKPEVETERRAAA